MSLNAISGTDAGEANRVRAMVKNQIMLVLIDPGSSHSFISLLFLQQVGIQFVASTPCKDQGHRERVESVDL